ncbi:MAG: MerR family transcriptional regulator [Anaerolineales bacterium]|nr:MerR family transcriptional regulator [Anaerolineales bacterium]MDW8161427.1 MerR family transcriptional regulator [Anaerolineales bacterium]
MTGPDTTPAFNLKVVLKETGIRPDTLRAWERRYGIPKPQRSPGGHRLYSQRDIETIKWLMARQAEGLSIARAVELFRTQIAQGRDPLAEVEETTPQPIAPPGTLESLRQSWLSACLAFNENEAELLLNQAFALYPLEIVIKEIFHYAMVYVGDQWYRNNISVQQEHFVSVLIQRRLNSLIAACPPPTRPEVILLGSPPHEQHLLPLLMLHLFLRRRGFGVVDLGANVPVAKFDETVARIQPHLVVLSAQRLTTVAPLLEVILSLHPLGASVAYGGRIFNLRPSLLPRIPAHFLGKTMDEAVQNVALLVHQRPPLPAPTPEFALNYQRAELFWSRRAQIEAWLYQALSELRLPQEYLTTAVEDFEETLRSALAVGDLDAILPELEWAQGLLRQHRLAPETLRPFLLGYAQAIRAAAPSELSPLAEWLQTTAERLSISSTSLSGGPDSG